MALDRAPTDQANVDAYGRARLPADGQVLILGDSLAGSPEDLPGAKLKARRRGRAPVEAYAVPLRAALGPRITVIDMTRPGARVLDTLRALPAPPKASAIVLSFGFAEAWGQSPPMPLPQFSNQVRRLIEGASACGCPIVVVPPPPVSVSAALAAKAQPYRAVVRKRAMVAEASLVDYNSRFRDVKAAWTDKVHLGAGGAHALANYVSARFVVGASDRPTGAR